MACKECEARRKLARDALFNAELLKSAGHVAKGAVEALGIKKKTGVAELKSAKRAKTTPAQPVNDADPAQE